ncbi:MAG: GLPGLI family protein [Bacteroidetes bacterium]|nr:GLPGLI family protein [Bacteroidota bacterium]
MFAFLLITLSLQTQAQIRSGRITFERKTNLFKKFKGEDDVSQWLKEEDKIKVDYFELTFNDTCSLFKPQESDLREKMEWATAKNIVYQNLNTNKRYLIKNFWGEELHLTDSLFKRKWKITQSSRKIAGYNCRKAIWQANDSTKIYAWFSYDIVPSLGPESFNGLPGTILGLATEDGGVIYFAKKLEILEPVTATFIPPKKKKTYTVPELKAEIKKRYGKEKWFKGLLESHFGIW